MKIIKQKNKFDDDLELIKTKINVTDLLKKLKKKK